MLYALAEFHRGGTRLSPEKAQAEIDKVLHDRKHAYWNENDAGHKSAKARMALLYERAARAESKAEAPKAPQSGKDARHAQLDAEIRVLTRHPAYLDKNHAEHATVKAKAEKLYAERWPD